MSLFDERQLPNFNSDSIHNLQFFRLHSQNFTNFIQVYRARTCRIKFFLPVLGKINETKWWIVYSRRYSPDQNWTARYNNVMLNNLYLDIIYTGKTIPNYQTHFRMNPTCHWSWKQNHIVRWWTQKSQFIIVLDYPTPDCIVSPWRPENNV